jgi:hypothetical protein
MNQYRITFKACTEQEYTVSAASEDQAERFAFNLLDSDETVSFGWKADALVVKICELLPSVQEKPKTKDKTDE